MAGDEIPGMLAPCQLRWRLCVAVVREPLDIFAVVCCGIMIENLDDIAGERVNYNLTTGREICEIDLPEIFGRSIPSGVCVIRIRIDRDGGAIQRFRRSPGDNAEIRARTFQTWHIVGGIACAVGGYRINVLPPVELRNDIAHRWKSVPVGYRISRKFLGGRKRYLRETGIVADVVRFIEISDELEIEQ